VPVHGASSALRLTGTVALVPLLTDASGSVAPLTAAETTTHAWTGPWAVLLLLVAVGGLVTAGLAVRRRARRGTDAPAQEDDGPAADETPAGRSLLR
jgi:hypothetical protein